MNNCHENAQCINTEGSFTCFCNPGYSGDGFNCTSKLVTVLKWNELYATYVHSTRLISIQPTNINTYELESYLCNSHESPAVLLTDIDECGLRTHTCNSNANCTDSDGSFDCTCREGFEGDGFNCTGMHSVLQALNVW